MPSLRGTKAYALASWQHPSALVVAFPLGVPAIVDHVVAAGNIAGLVGEHVFAAEDIGGLADPAGHTQNTVGHGRHSNFPDNLDHNSVVANTVGRSTGLALHGYTLHSAVAVVHHSRSRTAPVDHDPNHNHRSAVGHSHTPVLGQLPGMRFLGSRLGNRSWRRLEGLAATVSAEVVVALCND